MRIVIVDDEPSNVSFLKRVLQNYSTETFIHPREALQYCCQNDFDVLVSDQKMPDISGIELIRKVKEQNDDFTAIIISAYTDTDDLIDAVNSNLIYKYIVKPFSPDFLLQNVHRASETLSLLREKERLEMKLKEQNRDLAEENANLRSTLHNPLDDFIGFHQPITKMKELAAMYARSDEPLLISGETGTGKELIARAVHSLSAASRNQFIAVNCSAFSENLLESELFGFEKGAFTGAVHQKKGLVEMAAGGTLFLDEIGDFPLAFQAKVLRFIQFGTFFPIGSVTEKRVDVRIIAATNKQLEKEVVEGRFRKDLFYRINPLHVDIPPLRDRKEDILPIIDALAARKGYQLPPFTAAAEEYLFSYPFPGNVRELEGFVEKLYLRAAAHGTDRIDDAVVIDALTKGKNRYFYTAANQKAIEELNVNQSINLQDYIDSFQKEIIAQYLEFNKGNISRTANALSLSRQGLKNKMKKLQLSGGGQL
jgi:two-component system, NtrC family, response regulator HupR/HoxA